MKCPMLGCLIFLAVSSGFAAESQGRLAIDPSGKHAARSRGSCIATEGASDFYRGDIAQRIAADMRNNGGIITEEDLFQYRAIEREPLRGRYEDYRNRI